MGNNKKRIISQTLQLSRILLFITLAIPFISLLGQVLDVGLLKRVFFGSRPMGLVGLTLTLIGGVSLLLVQKLGYSKWAQLISLLLAGLLIISGIYKYVTMALQLEFIPDILLNKSLREVKPYINTLFDPLGAFITISMGVAFILYDKKYKISEPIFIFITIICLLIIYGHAYRVDVLTGIQGQSFGIFGAVCVLFMSLAALFARPTRGRMAVLIGEKPIQVVTMRLIAFFVPLVVGWGKLYGVNHGIFSEEGGTAIFAIFSYGTSMFFLQRQSSISYKLRKAKKKKRLIIKKDAKKLRSIIDNIPASIYIMDHDGRFTDGNKYFRKYHNVESQDFIGKQPEDVIKDKEVLELVRKREFLLENEDNQQSEYTLDENGRKRYFVNVSFSLKQVEDQKYGLCSISTEITELKEKEKKIEKQRIWLDYILENLTDGVVVADQKGEFLLYNKVGIEITGKGSKNVAPEDIPKKYHVYEENGKEHLPAEKLPLLRALKGEKVDDFKMMIKNPDFDKPRYLNVSGRPIEMEGEPTEAMVVFRDITREREILSQSKKEIEKLKKVLMSVKDGIILTNEDAEIVIYNKVAEEIFGKIPDKPTWEDVPEAYKVLSEDGKTKLSYKDLPGYKALQDDKVHEKILTVKHDDTLKKIQVIANPLTFDDGTKNVVAIINDITEFKK